MSSDYEVPSAADAVDGEDLEEIFTIPDIDEDPDGFAVYMVRQDLQVWLLNDDCEQDYNILMANYHSPTPSDWTYKIYMQYLRNSRALDHIRVLFKEPEEINLEDLKELFEDSVCNTDAVEWVDRDDQVVCADELLCNGDIADSKKDIVIIPCGNEDVMDGKLLPSLSYAPGVLHGSKSGLYMNTTEPIVKYYSEETSLIRSNMDIVDNNEREYFRFLHDRGRRLLIN